MIPAVIVAAAPMTLVAVVLAAWQFATGRRPPTPTRLLIIVLIACVLVVAALMSYEYAVLMQSWPGESWRGVFSFALVIAALLIMVGLVTQTGSRQLKIARLLPWAAAVLLPLAVIGWDVRTPWAKFVESSEPVPTALADLLPQRASVYWEGGLELLWLRLRRPSYFACDQGTGAVFFRGTAMEFQRREEALWPLRTVDFGRSLLCPSLDKIKKPERMRADLQQVCANAPGLDYLVLRHPVEDVEAKVWDSPVPNRDVHVSD